jgi:hypothetical protein
MKAKKGASSPIYLFWEKKPKKKKALPLLAHSCKCQNMISVTHFQTLCLGKNLSCHSIIRYPEKRHVHVYLLQRKIAPLVYLQLSEHLQRFAQYVTLPKTNSHPGSVTLFTLLQTHP